MPIIDERKSNKLKETKKMVGAMEEHHKWEWEIKKQGNWKKQRFKKRDERSQKKGKKYFQKQRQNKEKHESK